MIENRARRGCAVALALILLPSVVVSQEVGDRQEDDPKLSGTVALWAKYNSNLTLIDETSTGLKRKSAFITEPNADLRLSKSWGTEWWLDASVSGHANFHAAHAEQNWYFNRTHLSLVRALGANAVHFTSEFRYFTVPDENEFDFYRHTGIASYKHTLSPLWQLRVGYENIITQYPESFGLDYTVHGSFVEWTNTWSFNLSSYYSYEFQLYDGAADPQAEGPDARPDEGSRHTVRSGFDWLMSPRQAVSGTYMMQIDNSEFESIKIGDFEGDEGSQENEAEFDLTKHKATLLYTHRLKESVSLSAYEEWIRKKWDESDDSPDRQKSERTDNLFLSSLFLTYKWQPQLPFKFRYLFRMNASSTDLQDYVDHILFVGPEYKF